MIKITLSFPGKTNCDNFLTDLPKKNLGIWTFVHNKENDIMMNDKRYMTINFIPPSTAPQGEMMADIVVNLAKAVDENWGNFVSMTPSASTSLLTKS